MKNKLEVSFNSPQCGWMSIGFSDGRNEFHTTTAHTPYVDALPEILKGLASLLDAASAKDEFRIEWSRNPEAYDLFFERDHLFIVAVQKEREHANARVHERLP